jgi:hypothetical protein
MVELQLRSLLTSALVGGKKSVSPSGRRPLPPRERTYSTHLIEGQLGPRALLDIWRRDDNIECAGNRTLNLPSCRLVIIPAIQCSHPED